MNIILLSGGSGKRLWPLSNDIRSKQFIKIFKNNDGNYESMLQRIYRQIKNVDKSANITVATSISQVPSIKNQIGNNIGISVEPCRKDTFPAIVLATAYLRDVKNIDENESVVVCPIDPGVDEEYFQALKELHNFSVKDNANLFLMGIEPTYPSEKYGYIIPRNKEKISEVLRFKEKPDVETAKNFINQGALWNGGIFAYKISYVLEKAREIIDFKDYYDLFAKYESLKKISFDYAIVEHESLIKTMRFNGKWKDLGTWNTLTEAMEDHIIGNAVMDDKCSNVHIINETNIPLLAMGLKDVIISAGPDGILVSDKLESSFIKPFVDKIIQPVMFAEKSWGSYKVIDVGPVSMTIKITLTPGSSMNYHCHQKRNEVWVVISGKGITVVDGMEQSVKPGDVITMEAGCKHLVRAETELQIIEVQLGKDISIDDKQKYKLE